MVKYSGADYHAIYIYDKRLRSSLRNEMSKNIFIYKFTVTSFRVKKQTIWAT